MKNYLVLFLIGIGTSLLYAGPLEDAVIQHDKVLAYQAAGQRIPAQEIQKARLMLEPLTANPVARAYLGSLITLEASETSRTNPIKSLAQLSEGLGMVDEALAAQPDNAIIRRIRLINSVEVAESSPVKQWNNVREDLRWFHASWDLLSKQEQATVSLYEGIYKLKTGEVEDALDAFDLSIILDPGSVSATRAAQYLARYGE